MAANINIQPGSTLPPPPPPPPGGGCSMEGGVCSMEGGEKVEGLVPWKGALDKRGPWKDALEGPVLWNVSSSDVPALIAL